MARTDNLGDFLTDVADAIREAEGSSLPIAAQDMPERIANLELGLNENNYELYVVDYDGTPLLHKALNEGDQVNLREEVTIPEHEGKVFDHFVNPTASAIDADDVLTMPARDLVIGMEYANNSELSELTFQSLPGETSFTIYLRFATYVGNVDWGDGTIEAAAASMTHTYQAAGTYKATYQPECGLGSYAFLQSGNSSYYCDYLVDASIEGSDSSFTFTSYTFRNCRVLKTINFHRPRYQSTMQLFYLCPLLKAITLDNVYAAGTSASNYVMVGYAPSLDFLIISNSSAQGFTSNGGYYTGASSLASFFLGLKAFTVPDAQEEKNFAGSNGIIGSAYIPRGASMPLTFDPPTLTTSSQAAVHAIPTQGFVRVPSSFSLSTTSQYGVYRKDSYNLNVKAIITGNGSIVGGNLGAVKEVAFPDSITAIGRYFLQYYCGESIKFPPDLGFIGQNNFEPIPGAAVSNCVLYDFRDSSTVPTLSSNCFVAINPRAKIVVPDDLYDEWVAAANWSALSSHIVRASDYTE